ncbi:MAG: DUF4382 domain-containing protein [Deltaproteobacteria bacterium]|nr:DUF4382 domain-containing protein [Deltaproteobacteria bacterium]MBN2845653.1 DUF4382 domain-containing protein [Deltaproteobacteria bacterium]
MKRLKFIVIVFLVCFMMSLTACGGGDDESSSAAGSLALKLTDAATNDYQAVYVTIEEVQVCLDDENDEEENNWYTVAEPKRTYNLLELVNGVQAQLGVTDLDAGRYTQMRLIIGTEARDSHPYANYIVIVDDEDNPHELKVPSGSQTGIKLVSGFEIYENQTTELILDFDASRSVVKAGNSGKWILKPVIKVIGTTVATISGTVTDNEGLGLMGALVSAQFYDGDMIVQASTVTDENGDYRLFVEPNIYNLVAYKEGYAPKCKYIEVEPNSEYGDEDMALTSTSGEEGILKCEVEDVDPGNEDTSVSISVRQSTECEGGIGTTQIEIVMLNIADGGDYEISLPVETYHVVAETEEGFETFTSDPDDPVIKKGETYTLEIRFEPKL